MALMDRRLHILQELYGEGDDRAEARRRLNEEAELWEEYQALSEAKFMLDHRRRERPDSLVLEHIMAAAAGAPSADGAGRRRDRRPVPHLAARYRAFGMVSGVLALVMVIGTGVWQVLRPPAETTPVQHESALAEAPPAREEREPAGVSDPQAGAGRSTGEATPRPQAPALADSRAAAPPVAEPPAGVDEDAAAALAWDASDDVLELHRRIEMLEEGVGLQWDEPPVPLEAFPSARPADDRAGFQQAGQRLQPRFRNH